MVGLVAAAPVFVVIGFFVLYTGGFGVGQVLGAPGEGPGVWVLGAGEPTFIPGCYNGPLVGACYETPPPIPYPKARVAP